jgi:hypothetical protein
MTRRMWLPVALGFLIALGGSAARAAGGALDDISIPQIKKKVLSRIENEKEETRAHKPRHEGADGKDVYIQRIERRLAWVDGRIHQLVLDAERNGKTSKDRLDRELPNLRAQRRAAQRKLDELDDSAAGAWSKLKKGVDAAVNKLEQSIDRVGQKI